MLQTGTLLAGRYRIQQMVGTGGMGSVYAARDERLGRDVAIKLLRPDLAAQPAERQRFLKEGQIAAQVVHPHIVRTYDAGDAAEGPFLVQELLQGRSLDHALPLPVDPAIDVVSGVAGALSALHDQGYVHCDVKPQNIWLRPNGEAVLLDFGIARAEGTHTTTLIATPQYLAPERLDGHPPTAASDLYALGVVLYQLLTGRLPFDDPEMQAILAAQRNAPVPALGIAEPKAPMLDRIIARLMAKAPADRYPSALALQQELGALRATNSRLLEQHEQPTFVVGHAAGPPVSGNPPAAQPAVPVAAPPAAEAPQRLPHVRRRRSCWLPILLIVLLLLLLARARTHRIGASFRAIPVPALSTAASAPPIPPTDVVVPAVISQQEAPTPFAQNSAGGAAPPAPTPLPEKGKGKGNSRGKK